MKQKLLLNLILLLCGISPLIAHSTNYVPLVVEGAKWECYDATIHHDNRDSWFRPYSIEISGDTIVDDITYKRCVYSFEESTWTWENISAHSPTQTATLAFIREDVENKKVYARFSSSEKHEAYFQLGFYHSNDAEKEFLLYDFGNINNPEQIWQKSEYPKGPLHITAGKITIDGNERNCYLIDNEYSNLGCIIEGIGYDGYGYTQNTGDLLYQYPDFVAGSDRHPVFKAYKNAEGETIYNAGEAENMLYYQPLVREGVKWEYLYEEVNFISNTQTEQLFWIEMKGDSTINNMTYKKCFAWSNDTNKFVLGLIREDLQTKKVYRYDDSYPNKEVLLYDFNDVTKPDFIAPYNFSDEEIALSQVQYGYHYHNKFTFSSDNEVKFNIIEGIGFVSGKSSYSTGHLLNYLLPTPDSKDRLITFRRLVTSNNDITIYETPAGIERVSIDQKDSFLIFNGTALSTNQEAFIEIYNLSGHQVANTHGLSLSTSNLPTGLYVAKASTPNNSATIKIIVK